MEKKRVAVLFGGVSSEHEVSCLSASSVIRNIPKDKYEVVCLGITKAGSWHLYDGPVENIADGSWEKSPALRPAFLSPDALVHGISAGNESIRVDVVFPVLHGKNGEDGTMQGLFQLAQLPYVGCDTLSSAVCMDKGVTNTLLEAAGIGQAKFVWFFSRDYNKESVVKNIQEKLGGFPVFVKPANAGSSVGITKVSNEDGLDAAIATAAHEDKKIVIEENIDGQEVECAVLGNDDPVASVVGEIAPSAEFYDYDAKYVSGTSQLYIPAHIKDETAEAIRMAAVKAYRMLGCEGLARVDFFVRKSDGAVLLNELNTLPGFTSISMYPKLFEACGIFYGELLDKLITLAFERSRANG